MKLVREMRIDFIHEHIAEQLFVIYIKSISLTFKKELEGCYFFNPILYSFEINIWNFSYQLLKY